MQRNCRYVPLAHQPLSLVLAQVKFSPLRQLAQYVPAIQEAFRRGGYPIERSGKLQQVTLAGAGAPQITEQQRWEYRTRSETKSVLVLEDSVVLQTTEYDRFESFANELVTAFRTVMEVTEHHKYGVVQRLGLRYINRVRPSPGRDYRFYLKPGLCGAADAVFQPGTHRVHVQSTGKTKLADAEGVLVIRVSQMEGMALPLDVLTSAPKHALSAPPGEMTTFVDMDHFVEGSFDPNADWVGARAYELHDHVIEAFHNHVATPEAIEEWK
jgi:uncharacterized protein (TIGR04255 family)